MPFRLRAFAGLLFLLFCTYYAHSQENIDADLKWYDSFFEEGEKRQIEVLLQQADTKLQQAKLVNDAAAQAKAHTETGLIYLTVYDFRAIDFFNLALVIEDSARLDEPKLFTCLALAKASEMTGDLKNSVERLMQASHINNRLKNVNVHARILNQLGKVYAAGGNIDTAFQYFEQVLREKEQIQIPGAEAEALFNLGHLYTTLRNYPEALDRHKQALKIWRSVGDKKNEAISLNDIGELYTQLKNDDRTLANHVAALEIRNSLHDRRGAAQSYNNIGALYYRQKQYEKAIANLLPALSAAQELQAQHEIAKSYDYLRMSYTELGDYKKALQYGNLLTAINELIQTEKSDRKPAELEMLLRQGQIKSLEKDNLLRQKEIQRQKDRQLYLSSFIVLSVIIASLILYLYLLKRKSNKVLEKTNLTIQEQNLALQDLNATKDKFFSIISHDLKGPLNSLTSFSGLLINHMDSLSKEEIRMLAQDLDKSVKNLFALLENLLEWSRSQTGNIEFKPEAFDLSVVMEDNKALLQAQAQHKKIDITYQTTGARVVNAHKNSVNTVVRNLISNAIKFTPEGGTILLSVESTQGQMQVSIADNGVGMPPEIIQKLFRIDTKHSTKGTANEKGTGLGLILCKEFIEKNGGRIWVESEPGKGSIFNFTLLRPLLM